jgi:hypothetical protein
MLQFGKEVPHFAWKKFSRLAKHPVEKLHVLPLQK